MFISCIIFIVLLFVYFIIYKNLQDKSKVALESANFEEVVAKITKNIEEPDEELSDAINEKGKRDTDKNE